MMNLSLAEIVNTACQLKTKNEKIEWLRKNNSLPLRNILKVMYDKNLELNIPNVAPPYQPSVINESHGLLYRETRKLKYFVKGYDGENIHPIRREALFIQILESVDKDDAELLIKMIAKKPLKGLPLSVLNEAFGENFIPKSK